MVFNNEDYLKAFPRTEKTVAAPAAAPVSTNTPGDALEPEPEELPADPAVEDLPDQAAEEGGAADGDE